MLIRLARSQSTTAPCLTGTDVLLSSMQATANASAVVVGSGRAQATALAIASATASIAASYASATAAAASAVAVSGKPFASTPRPGIQADMHRSLKPLESMPQQLHQKVQSMQQA